MNSNNIESRTFRNEAIIDGESRTVVGNASVFNVRTKINTRNGFYYEEIDPGAFKNADFTRCKMLFDHKSFLVLGATSSGTLQIKPNDTGLGYSVVLPKTREDVKELVERKDITECSFAFIIREGGEIMSRAADGNTLVRITDIEAVLDLSLVPYPAYPGTNAEIQASHRSQELIEAFEKPLQEEKPLISKPYSHIARLRALNIFS